MFQAYHPPLDPDNYVQTAHNSSFGEISLHQLDVFGINTYKTSIDLGLKKVQNPYLPYFEEHKKVLNADLPYLEEHKKLR